MEDSTTLDGVWVWERKIMGGIIAADTCLTEVGVVEIHYTHLSFFTISLNSSETPLLSLSSAFYPFKKGASSRDHLS